MKLKIATTACFIAGMLLLLLWPLLMGPRPSGNARAVALYASRLLAYFSVTATLFLVTAVLALLVVRAARRAYVEEATSNLKDLVEGSLQSHVDKP